MPIAKEVVWFENSRSLSEIYQQTGFCFAFVSPPRTGLKMCHEWVKCRDFLQDAVRSTLTGNSCSIYGFSFDPAVNPPVDLKKMRILVSKHGLKDEDLPEFRNKIRAGLSLVNHFEKQAKVSLSKLQEMPTKGSDKKVVWMFTGPAMWVKSPFLVSMYTYLIRLGDKELKFKNAPQLKKALKELTLSKDRTTSVDNDVKYLKEMWQKLHIIIKHRKELFVEEGGFDRVYYLEKYGISAFHNNGGILSLSRGTTFDADINKKVKEVTT